MHPTHVWTLDEANAALPRVEEMVREAQQVLAQAEDAKAHAEDLRLVHGAAVQDPACPDYAEFGRHAARLEDAQARLQDIMETFQLQGIALKDLRLGLVDFASRRGDEVVWLCHRQGEPRVAHWHPLDSGYADRRPVPELPEAGA